MTYRRSWPDESGADGGGREYDAPSSQPARRCLETNVRVPMAASRRAAAPVCLPAACRRGGSRVTRHISRVGHRPARRPTAPRSPSAVRLCIAPAHRAASPLPWPCPLHPRTASKSNSRSLPPSSLCSATLRPASDSS